MSMNAVLARMPSMQMRAPVSTGHTAPSSPCVRSNSPGLAAVNSPSPTTIPAHVSKGISSTGGGSNRPLFSQSSSPQNKASRKEQLIEAIIE